MAAFFLLPFSSWRHFLKANVFCVFFMCNVIVLYDCIRGRRLCAKMCNLVGVLRYLTPRTHTSRSTSGAQPTVMSCCAGSVQYRSNPGNLSQVMQILQLATRKHDELDHTDHDYLPCLDDLNYELYWEQIIQIIQIICNHTDHLHLLDAMVEGDCVRDKYG